MSYCRNCAKEIGPQAAVCLNCGVPAPKGDRFCQNCGKPSDPIAEFCPACGVRLSQARVQTETGAGVSPKSRLAMTLLSFFLGEFGAHRFYAGKTGTAIVMLVLTIVGFATLIFFVGLVPLAAVGIWSLVDFIYAIAGNFKDKEGRPITKW